MYLSSQKEKWIYDLKKEIQSVTWYKKGNHERAEGNTDALLVIWTSEVGYNSNFDP